jgi:hypothetical protein
MEIPENIKNGLDQLKAELEEVSREAETAAADVLSVDAPPPAAKAPARKKKKPAPAKKYPERRPLFRFSPMPDRRGGRIVAHIQIDEARDPFIAANLIDGKNVEITISAKTDEQAFKFLKMARQSIRGAKDERDKDSGNSSAHA